MVVVSNLFIKAFSEVYLNAVNVFNSFFVTIHLFLDPIEWFSVFAERYSWLSKFSGSVDIQLVACATVQQTVITM